MADFAFSDTPQGTEKSTSTRRRDERMPILFRNSSSMTTAILWLTISPSNTGNTMDVNSAVLPTSSLASLPIALTCPVSALTATQVGSESTTPLPVL